MDKFLEHSYNKFEYKAKLKTSGNIEPGDFIIESEEVKQKPESLFKYYSLNRNGFYSLANNRLYASHPQKFNDPYDCSPEIIDFSNASDNDIKAISLNSLDYSSLIKLKKSNILAEKQKLNKILQKRYFFIFYMTFGVFSMTKNSTSMEMWSYYNSHKGFCMKYNVNLLPDSFFGPYPINYSEKIESLDYDKLKFGSFLYQSNIKAISWKPENEWRLLFYKDHAMETPCFKPKSIKNRFFYFNPKAIEEIILGYNFFDLCEIDIENSNNQVTYVKLKYNKKLKQKFLRQIITREIPVSMIKRKIGVDPGLTSKKVEIIKLSNTKYKIKYVG